jgi:hypothetical protein
MFRMRGVCLPPAWRTLYLATIGRVVDWLLWGETDVTELWPLWAYCSSPGDFDVDHGMMVSTGANSSTRVLWQPPVLSGGPVSRGISGVSRRIAEGNENLVYPSSWDFKPSLTCRKNLTTWDLRLYFPSERRCAADFYHP